jgi:REP element-mobilizing transposase RayT
MPSTSPNPKYRKSIRMATFDYSQPGAYFVTITAHQRQPLLGSLLDGHVHLSPLGELVSSVWLGLPGRFSEVETDDFIVMPDHFHGILFLKEPGSMENKSLSVSTPLRLSLSTLISAYKSTVTRVYHFNNLDIKGPVWQRNYYEHIIRHDHELDQIRKYIQENPARWEKNDNDPPWM